MTNALRTIQRHVHARCNHNKRHGNNDHCSRLAQRRNERFSTFYQLPSPFLSILLVLLLMLETVLFRRVPSWIPLSSSICHLQVSLAVSFHSYSSPMRTLRRPSASNVLLYVDKYFDVAKRANFQLHHILPYFPCDRMSYFKTSQLVQAF